MRTACLAWGAGVPAPAVSRTAKRANSRRCLVAAPLHRSDQSDEQEGRAVGRITVLDEIAIADCALQLDGADLDDLFATAVQALAAVMVDPETLPVTVERTLTLTAPSLDLLLYDWLSEMIYVKDAEQIVFTRAAVHVDEAPPRLRARLGGGRLDP